MAVRADGTRRSLMEWLRFPEVTLAALQPWMGDGAFDPLLVEEVEEDAAYAPYLARQDAELRDLRSSDAVRSAMISLRRGARPFQRDGGAVAACPAGYAGGGGPDRRDHPGGACQPAGPRAAARGMTITSEADAQAWLRDRLGVDAAGMARLTRLADLLVAENERQNLVARGTLAHVWQRHIVDSAQLSMFHVKHCRRGRGSIWGPERAFRGWSWRRCSPNGTSRWSIRRLRTEWLERAAAALDLANVEVILARVEDVPARIASVISARAFAPLDKLLLLSARFSTPDTLWLLPKGAKAKHELDMLPKSWRHMFHVEQSLTDPDAGVIAGRLLGGQPRLSKRPNAGRKLADDYHRCRQPEGRSGQDHHRDQHRHRAGRHRLESAAGRSRSAGQCLDRDRRRFARARTFVV
jgi:16S rRNA (guanine527-N7)-methyltransferase